MPASPRRTPSWSSTARTLAQQGSPPSSPSHISSFSAAPGRGQRRTSSTLHIADEAGPGLYRQRSGSVEEEPWTSRVVSRAIKTGRGAWRAYAQLSRGQQALAALVVATMLAAGVVLLVYNERIYGWLYPHAQAFAGVPGGWALVWLFIVATAFPPMMGYSTAVTLCGFIYGMKGWLVCSTANVAGSALSFLVFRRYLSNVSAKLAAKDPRFAAFNLVLARDGLPLLIAIRLCPLPYSLSNAGLSTLPPVRALPFALATAAATPKLLIHVFIGDRLAAIARGDQGGMDAGAKAANYIGIAVGVLVGVGTGVVIYRRTVARARQLEAEQVAAAEEEEGLAAGWDGEEYQENDTRGQAPGLAHPDAFEDDDDPWGHSEERESRDEINFLGLDDARGKD